MGSFLSFILALLLPAIGVGLMVQAFRVISRG